MNKLTGIFGGLLGGGHEATTRAPEDGAGAKPVPVADLPKPATDDLANWHLAARITLSAALLGLGVTMLSNYLRALVWAVVLAIALWPLFERAAARVGPKLRGEVLPLVFTLMVALVFVVPFALLGVEAVREAHTVLDTYKQAEANGIPVPEAVSKLPEKVAQPVTTWWNDNLSHSGWAKDLAEKVDTTSNRELGKNVGRDAIHRVVLFGFALLALFFLFKEGHAVVEQTRSASNRLFGPRGERIGRQVVSSIHGTVNGLVLVGLGEGVVLGVVYFFAGVPHPILFGAFTAVAAMIPFAAAVAIVLAAGAVLAAGKTVAAIVILGAGFATTFAADHFVRPSLIGGTTRLPFIWVLLGILGGVETFGLLGLFIGPAVMAALILLWREVAGRRGSAEDDVPEIDRLSQYRYLIRAMRVEDKRSLEKARLQFSSDGIDVFDEDFVFRNKLPCGDSFACITANFFDLLSTRRVPGGRNFYRLLESYLVIIIESDCCGSWDRYLVTTTGGLATRCNFCGSLLDLGGAEVATQPSRLVSRKMLVERFGLETEAQWMCIETLARLAQARS